MKITSFANLTCLLLACLLATASCFVTTTPLSSSWGQRTASMAACTPSERITKLHLSPADPSLFTTATPSTVTLAVDTIDPTSFLSNVLGSFIGSPAVLAIPIVAAILVASAIAWLILAYSSPAVEDDE